MTCQLRRMVLVNLGTNKHVPSQRITEIDPRGGAAVIGANGVGKTTTLRLIPLFFGHLPSQIIAAGTGQEALIRFVLPTPASALAFEYQRGDDPDDIRLAVIRRQDGSDAPEYRIYRCGFIKELFTEDGRFLEDHESETRATALGIKSTIKLNSADYRAVILGTGVSHKRKAAFREMVLEFSFGRKRLDGLDRLVAAMVKKHVSFTDLVQVSIGSVQEELGIGSHAERNKLSLKQSKAQIDRYLDSRDACDEALKLSPQVDALRSSIAAHATQEAVLRERRGDVRTLQGQRTIDKATCEAAIATLLTARAVDEEAQSRRRLELDSETSAKTTRAEKSKLAYEAAKAESDHYEQTEAARWSDRLDGLPVQRNQKTQLDGRIEAMTLSAASAVAEYERQAIAASTALAKLQLEQEESKKGPRDQHDKDLALIAKAQSEAAESLETKFRAEREETTEAYAQSSAILAALKARAESPQATGATMLSLDAATAGLNDHLREVNKIAERKSAASERVAKARAEHETCGRTHAEARQKRDLARGEQTQATLVLSPPDGTVLSSLRSHASEEWKADLARILNPELLLRTDVSFHHLGEGIDAAFGWAIDTGAIAPPAWTVDSTLRQAVADAEERLGLAESFVTQCHTRFGTASTELDKVTGTESVAVAELSVLNARTRTIEAAEATARALRDEEREQFTKECASKLATAASDARQAKLELDGLPEVENDKRRKLHSPFESDRAQAQSRLDGALRSIDATKRGAAIATKASIAAIEQQRDDHLRREGIDVEALSRLKTQSQALGSAISGLEQREPLVMRWRAWVAAQGPVRLADLRRSAATDQREASDASAALGKFRQETEESQTRFSVAKRKLDTVSTDLQDELDELAKLEVSLADYLPRQVSMIDPRMPARELKGRIISERAEMERLNDAIRVSFNDLRFRLTRREGPIKTLIESGIDGSSATTTPGRAHELCIHYKHVGQVVGDVNTTLKLILASVSKFQEAMSDFESEVGRFNAKLQRGLNEVTGFERLRDLKLEIVTNFDQLGYMKKVKKLSELAREQRLAEGLEHSQTLPSDDYSQALRDFRGVIGADGGIEVNLSQHISLRGSVVQNGVTSPFHRESELENVSSNGLTSIILISLLAGLLNTIRDKDRIHVPWVTDEVGTFDGKNFAALMEMLKVNMIDVVTASPELSPVQHKRFSQHYQLADRGEILVFRKQARTQRPEPKTAEVIA